MKLSTINHSDLNATHQENILSLLSHRLEVARAHHNPTLVAALENEYEQLKVIAQPVTVSSRLQQLWMSFAETLNYWGKVHIEQTVDADGKPSWYAYNPQKGQIITTRSETEMHRWIKANYWGR